MAVGKKSFILYTDLLHTFEGLDDQEAGKLIKHLLRYVNDMNPEAPDKLIKIAFEPIKQMLKRDLKSGIILGRCGVWQVKQAQTKESKINKC